MTGHFDITHANHRQVVKRLVAMVDQAPDDVLADGLSWYERAHDAARGLASDLSITVRQAAGMVACASPRIDAGVITSEIRNILDGGTSQVTGGQRRKVEHCLRRDPLDVLSPRTSPKTSAFFWNVYAPSLRDHVTVDGRHADIIANCRRPWKAKRGIDMGGPNTRYESYEFVTEDAARELRRMPRFERITAVQVQAITWCEGRRIERIGDTQRGNPRKTGVHRMGQTYTEGR